MNGNSLKMDFILLVRGKSGTWFNPVFSVVKFKNGGED